MDTSCSVLSHTSFFTGNDPNGVVTPQWDQGADATSMLKMRYPWSTIGTRKQLCLSQLLSKELLAMKIYFLHNSAKLCSQREMKPGHARTGLPQEGRHSLESWMCLQTAIVFVYLWCRWDSYSLKQGHLKIIWRFLPTSFINSYFLPRWAVTRKLHMKC